MKFMTLIYWAWDNEQYPIMPISFHKKLSFINKA